MRVRVRGAVPLAPDRLCSDHSLDHGGLAEPRMLHALRRAHLSRETKATPVRTYTPKPGDVEKNWYVIDATDVVLSRLAAQAANLLRGKHKPRFAPHADCGDYVIIINADKVALTNGKADKKLRPFPAISSI